MKLTRIGAKTKKQPDTTDFFENTKAEVQFSSHIIKLHFKGIEDGKGNSHNYEINFTFKELFQILEELNNFITLPASEDSKLSENSLPNSDTIEFSKKVINNYLTTKTDILLKLLLISSGLLNNSEQKNNEEFLKIAIHMNEDFTV